MPPAARISDMHVCPLVTPGTPPVPHVGGPVVAGAPTVLTAFMPQARVGDTCTCVGPPDAIAMGSPTVLVCGMPAARLGDATVHGGSVVAGAPNVLIGASGAGGSAGGGPAVLGPNQIGEATSGDGPPPVARPPERQDSSDERSFERRLGGDDNVDVMFFEASGAASAGDGRASAEGETALGMARMEHSGHMVGALGGSHEMQSHTADAKFYGSVGTTGLGAEVEASARLTEQEGSLFLGPDANNPYAEAGAGYSLMKAEASGDALLGSDGRRAGVALGGKASASVADGSAGGEVNIPIPFTNWTFSVRGKVSGDVAAAGVGGGGHAYKDLQTGRYHGGFFGEAAAFLGIGADLDFSIGPPYESRDRRH